MRQITKFLSLCVSCVVCVWFIVTYPPKNLTGDNLMNYTLSSDVIYSIQRFTECPRCTKTDTKWIREALKHDPVINGTFYNFGLDYELQHSLFGSPLDHLSEFKNPCWISRLTTDLPYVGNPKTQIHRIVNEMAQVFMDKKKQYGISWRVRCLPYFYILGVSKSGTTDMYHRLIHHQDIYQPVTKEATFWDRYVKFTKKDRSATNMKLYLDNFDKAAELIYRNHTVVDNSVYYPGITVDASPTTLWVFPKWWLNPSNDDVSGPTYISANVIHKLTPNARFIVLLREPALRLHSHFHMTTPSGTAEQFHDLLVKSLPVWEKCVAERGIRSCAYNSSLMLSERSPNKTTVTGIFVRASMYTVFLKDWLSIFRRDQFLILRAEDYYDNIVGSLKTIFDFLQVQQPDDLSPYDELKVFNTGENLGRNTDPMMPETREILDRLFQPMKEELADLLHDQRFLWDKY